MEEKNDEGAEHMIEFLEPEATMNIYAQKDHKVRFLNKNGHTNEPENACVIGLIEGAVYTVEKTVVHSWSTEVYLQEFPSYSFNSVMFEDVVS
jgi:hypothetical protein